MDMGEKATIRGMAATTQERPMDLERPIKEIGTDLAARMPRPRLVSTARVEQRMTDMLMKDPALRAALFRFVDVTPACGSLDELARHLVGYLDEVEQPPQSMRAAMRMSESSAGRAALGAAAAAGVRHMARRFGR